MVAANVDSAEDHSMLVLHPTLRHLAAYPNQFQGHAQASLRLLDRRRRRARERVAPRQPACKPASVATLVTSAQPETRISLTCSEPAPAPCTKEATSLDEADAAIEVPEAMMRQTSQQTLKEVMSDPLLLTSHQRPPSSTTSSRMPSASSLPLLDTGRLADWPKEVCMLLDPCLLDQCQASEGNEEEWLRPRTERLRLVAAAFQIPHPRKAESGGEDSYFVSSDGCAAGVADGVGEWEWRFKLNPRAFADELMQGACSRAVSATAEASLTSHERAASALSEGFAASKSFGSATAIVATLDSLTSELGIASLGDSGLRQVRPQHSGSSDLGMRIVNRTTDQQHSFNCPFQLARLPEPKDFPRLLAEGKGALVKAVRNCPASRQDKPSDAQTYTFSVQEGDLIILGTDGVFDNLHDREVCQLAECAVSPMEARQAFDLTSGTLQGRGCTDASKVAEAIAQAAFYRSRDASARTPFSLHAKEAGLYHVGGKMDDITVVAAWVVRT